MSGAPEPEALAADTTMPSPQPGGPDAATAPGAAVGSQVQLPAGFDLTRREREILALLAQRLTNPEIAEQLSISPRTVQQHLTNLYAKLNVASRAAATRFAFENGLVRSG